MPGQILGDLLTEDLVQAQLDFCLPTSEYRKQFCHEFRKTERGRFYCPDSWSLFGESVSFDAQLAPDIECCLTRLHAVARWRHNS